MLRKVNVTACFGALIFAGYIIFDTWLILSKYSENEWIMAEINLYLDIITPTDI